MNSHLRFKLIDSFYQNIKDDDVREMFTKVLLHRVEAYQGRYKEGLFPLSVEDFICQHIAIEDSQTKEILGSFKYVNNKTCQEFNVPFPILSTLNTPNSQFHYQKVQQRVSELEKHNKIIGYIGSLNVTDKLRINPERRKAVKNMLAAGIVHYTNQDEASSVIVTGSIPNGSHLFIQWLGFDILCETPVNVQNIGKTEAYVMEWEKWSDSALKNALSYSDQWQSRSVTPTAQMPQETEKVNQTA